MPTVLLQGSIAPNHVDTLRPHLDQNWDILVWDSRTDNPADFAALAARADVIVGGAIPGNVWPPSPRLKLFQIPWAGHNFTSAARMPEGVPVCNCFEHESSIAEFVMLGILEWQIGLRRIDARFREKGWDGRMSGSGAMHGEVAGKTVGVIGYGHIGTAVARRARAFDMKVIGIRRTVRETPAELDWLGDMSRLDELLDQSDFVIIACDLNETTQNLIDAKRLAAMRADAVLINVARGGVVVEQDLYEALRDRRIGGAIIDVWYQYNEPGQPEVWPSVFPFQDLDNTILSAHESAMTNGQVQRRWAFVADNLRRIEAGQAPQNLLYTGQARPGVPW